MSIVFKIDTGIDINVISRKTFRKFKKTTELKTYTQHLQKSR